jgi:hypothetical protein
MRGGPNLADAWSKAELVELTDLLKMLNASNQQLNQM